MAEIKVIASIPDTKFHAEVTGKTLEEAQKTALEVIDKQIDTAIGGLSHGTVALERNRELKSAVVVVPPLKK